MPARRAALPILLAAALAAGESQPDVAAQALEELRAANQARADLAREESAWRSESQRLAALVAATRAETSRLERDATAAETARDAARDRLAALGTSSDLDALRARLSEAGDRLAAQLAAATRAMPPGVLPANPSGDGSFDAAVRALEAAERAATSVAIEVVTGQRDGRPQAVKMLRVAGAAAWWIALDGSAAGPVRIVDGVVTLAPAGAEDRAAIAAALNQAEGRSQPGLVLLPGARP